MRSGEFTFEVQTHGRPLVEYPHQGQTFIEGRIGSEYSLVAQNHTPGRVLVVVSVDGLSVMHGKEASRDDPGYILESYGRMEIPGWRLDDQQVAHFNFATLPQAYASQMGRPRNIGVIAAVFYQEKRRADVFAGDLRMPVLAAPDLPDTDGDQIFQTARGGDRKKSAGVGTGFGRRTEHAVTHVQFERVHPAAATIEIRYETAEELAHRGITVTTPHADRVATAVAFPANGCKPPPGWKPEGVDLLRP